jgi:3',5'-cyclic-AMP phosphodiesterase
MGQLNRQSIARLPKQGIQMIIAHISDLHVGLPGERLFNRVETDQMVANAIQQIQTLDPLPDVVVATGDLVNLGSLSEYEYLKSLLQDLKIPIFLLPGNHDDQATMRQAFPEATYWPAHGTALNYTVDQFPVRLIMLDTIVAQQPEGMLSEDSLAWLETQLAAKPEQPTIIFLHHPPFISGIAMMDPIRLLNSDRLADIVSRYANVERVACGHIHRPIQCRWAGTLACSTPSLVHQVSLDLRPDYAGSYHLEPPAYMLYTWIEGQGIVSHLQYVGPFAGPYDFE